MIYDFRSVVTIGYEIWLLENKNSTLLPFEYSSFYDDTGEK